MALSARLRSVSDVLTTRSAARRIASGGWRFQPEKSAAACSGAMPQSEMPFSWEMLARAVADSLSKWLHSKLTTVSEALSASAPPSATPATSSSSLWARSSSVSEALSLKVVASTIPSSKPIAFWPRSSTVSEVLRASALTIARRLSNSGKLLFRLSAVSDLLTAKRTPSTRAPVTPRCFCCRLSSLSLPARRS